VRYDVSIMMKRTQISLEPETLRKARHKAHDLGISLAEYIRRLLEQDLRQNERAGTDPTGVFNLGSSGGSDIARDEDRSIAEAIEAGREPRR